jgi:OOP family OmpA-OmpF porin
MMAGRDFARPGCHPMLIRHFLRISSTPNLHARLCAGLCLGALLACRPALAQAPGYLQDSNGSVARSAYGTCWHSGSWTPGDAVVGCDGVLQPPMTKMTAPPLIVVVPPVPPVPPAPPPQPCDFHATVAGEGAFSFDNTTLGLPAQRQLAEAVLKPLHDCSKIVSITVIGHTDRLGTASYNQKLSERRAAVVAAWLLSQGVHAPIDTEGVGATQPVADCDDNLGMKILEQCLAPNRRVELSISGTRTN